jgi:redox-sensitive bicupin YhaK (pirin superfamily)
MTAASGIIHEEYHSPAFAKTGGPFRMVQLWVNLPAKDKMAPGGYQGIVSADIPVVDLPDASGTARIIAGELFGTRGPARTFTPINLWDVKLNRDADVTLPAPDGHTTMLVVLSGHVTVNGTQEAGAAEMILLSREGGEVAIHADGDATLMVLTGEPIDEPIFGHGPFVMNTEKEIRQAFDDYNNGRFTTMAA